MVLNLRLNSRALNLKPSQRSLQFGKLIYKLLGFHGHNLPAEAQSEERVGLKRAVLLPTLSYSDTTNYRSSKLYLRNNRKDITLDCSVY